MTATTMQRRQKMMNPSSNVWLWRCNGPKTTCLPRCQPGGLVDIDLLP
jgi:hypothetical protein